MTPAQFVVYTTKLLPPKELLYDGWQKEPITYDGKEILFAHFWLIEHKEVVPKFLQCDGWDTEKFLYGLVKESVCKNQHTVNFCGTVKDAYKFYGIDAL